MHNKHARCSKHIQRTNPTDFRAPSYFGTCRTAPPQGGLGAESTPKPTPTPQGVCGKALTAGDSIRPPESTRAQSVLILARCGGGGVQRSSGAKHGPRGSKLSNSNSLGFFGRPLAPVRGLWAPSCDGATRAIIRPLFLFTPLHLPVPRVPVGSHTAQMSNIALTWLNHMVVGCS